LSFHLDGQIWQIFLKISKRKLRKSVKNECMR
jgi:hypothetical protein